MNVKDIKQPGDPKLIKYSIEYLKIFVNSIFHKNLRDGTMEVLEDPKFLACPAAKSKHQAYTGGLVVHTAEVMNSAKLMSCSYHLKVNVDVLVAAVVWHDYGKIYDYTVNDVPSGCPSVDGKEPPSLGILIDYTEHQKLIRHLPRSYAMFISEFGDNLEAEMIDAIGHCILSHHGRKEWGSPVEPQTAEAHILHFADMLSAYCAEEKYDF